MEELEELIKNKEKYYKKEILKAFKEELKSLEQSQEFNTEYIENLIDIQLNRTKKNKKLVLSIENEILKPIIKILHSSVTKVEDTIKVSNLIKKKIINSMYKNNKKMKLLSINKLIESGYFNIIFVNTLKQDMYVLSIFNDIKKTIYQSSSTKNNSNYFINKLIEIKKYEYFQYDQKSMEKIIEMYTNKLNTSEKMNRIIEIERAKLSSMIETIKEYDEDYQIEYTNIISDLYEYLMSLCNIYYELDWKKIDIFINIFNTVVNYYHGLQDSIRKKFPYIIDVHANVDCNILYNENILYKAFKSKTLSKKTLDNYINIILKNYNPRDAYSFLIRINTEFLKIFPNFFKKDYKNNLNENKIFLQNFALSLSKSSKLKKFSSDYNLFKKETSIFEILINIPIFLYFYPFLNDYYKKFYKKCYEENFMWFIYIYSSYFYSSWYLKTSSLAYLQSSLLESSDFLYFTSKENNSKNSKYYYKNFIEKMEKHFDYFYDNFIKDLNFNFHSHYRRFIDNFNQYCIDMIKHTIIINDYNTALTSYIKDKNISVFDKIVKKISQIEKINIFNKNLYDKLQNFMTKEEKEKKKIITTLLHIVIKQSPKSSLEAELINNIKWNQIIYNSRNHHENEINEQWNQNMSIEKDEYILKKYHMPRKYELVLEKLISKFYKKNSPFFKLHKKSLKNSFESKYFNNIQIKHILNLNRCNNRFNFEKSMFIINPQTRSILRKTGMPIIKKIKKD